MTTHRIPVRVATLHRTGPKVSRRRGTCPARSLGWSAAARCACRSRHIAEGCPGARSAFVPAWRRHARACASANALVSPRAGLIDAKAVRWPMCEASWTRRRSAECGLRFGRARACVRGRTAPPSRRPRLRAGHVLISSARALAGEAAIARRPISRNSLSRSEQAASYGPWPACIGLSRTRARLPRLDHGS